MDRRLPPPNWLRAFEAAARYLSFTRAAKELNVTQSTVSQQIRLLEHYLATPLFRRFPRRLELTDAGRAYLPSVRDAFERLARGTDELFGFDADRTLTVRLNVAFAILWLAPRLKSFHLQHPEVELRMVNSVWPDEATLDTIDLEIRFGKGDWPGVIAERITREALFPVCAPELAVGSTGLRKPADLANFTLIHSIGNADGWLKWLDAAGVELANANRGVQVDTSAVAYEMAAAGLGVALGRTSLVQAMLGRGALVAPFEARVPTDDAFYLTYVDQIRQYPPAVAFCEWLRDQARE